MTRKTERERKTERMRLLDFSIIYRCMLMDLIQLLFFLFFFLLFQVNTRQRLPAHREHAVHLSLHWLIYFGIVAYSVPLGDSGNKTSSTVFPIFASCFIHDNLYKKMYLCWSLCTFYLHDSGFCCWPCVTSFGR